MSDKDRNILCAELRDKILNTVSQNGGHLASNLGVVELTVAMLSVFDYKRDSIFSTWDTSLIPISYLLADLNVLIRFPQGRNIRVSENFESLPTTHSDTGHSSTSISAALGIARARDLNKSRNMSLY